MRNLLEMFNNITPDNIKNLPVVQESMVIFLETLMARSKETIDLKNFYKNEEIKNELVQIYLGDLYNTLKQVQFNSALIDAIDRQNSYYPEGMGVYKADTIQNIMEHITDEHFMTFKSYRESKGTIKAIQYIYDFVKALLVSGKESSLNLAMRGFSQGNSASDLTIIENSPFDLTIEGELIPEAYNFIIHPLAHPLGFTYVYYRKMLLDLIDYFPEVNIVYYTKSLEVRTVYADGTIIVTNILPDENGTEVIFLRDYVDNRIRTREIYLSDGTYYTQNTYTNGHTTVELFETNTGVRLKKFEDESYIYFDYDYEVRTSVTDEAHNEQEWPHLDPYARMGMTGISCDIMIIGQNYKPNLTGEWSIGGCDYLNRDFGFNIYRDRDGKVIHPGDEKLGRMENRFYPTAEADLMELAGEYVLDVKVYDENDKFIGLEPIKYTPGVVNDPKNVIIPRIYLGSAANYELTNQFENPDYLAREYFVSFSEGFLEDEFPETEEGLCTFYSETIFEEEFPELGDGIDNTVETELENQLNDRWKRIGIDTFDGGKFIIGTNEIFYPGKPIDFFIFNGIAARTGEWVIGGGPTFYQPYEIGYNTHLTPDGYTLQPTSETKGRVEHSYHPTAQGDLNELLGNYTLNYKVYDSNGDYVRTEPKRYGSRDESQNVIQVVPFVPSVATYIEQNKENEGYTAYELLITEISSPGGDFTDDFPETDEKDKTVIAPFLEDDYEVQSEETLDEVQAELVDIYQRDQLDAITTEKVIIGLNERIDPTKPKEYFRENHIPALIADWIIGGIDLKYHSYEMGYNPTRNRDGKVVYPANYSLGRREHSFYPTAIADLMELSGNYSLDVTVYNEDGEKVGFEPKTYGIKDPEQDIISCIDFIPSVATYIEQNEENNGYTAYELLVIRSESFLIDNYEFSDDKMFEIQTESEIKDVFTTDKILDSVDISSEVEITDNFDTVETIKSLISFDSEIGLVDTVEIEKISEKSEESFNSNIIDEYTTHEIYAIFETFVSDNFVENFGRLRPDALIGELLEISEFKENKDYYRKRGIPALFADWIIGGDSTRGYSYNPRRNAAGHVVYPENYLEGRNELSFEIPEKFDIMELNGQYSLDTTVFHEGKKVGFEPKTYSEEITDSKNAVIDFEITVEEYQEQNFENEGYVKEYLDFQIIKVQKKVA